MATGAKYKVYNGSTWVEYYFPTSADLVIESDTKKFVSAAEKTTITAISGLTSAGFLKKTSTGWTIDTTSYLTANSSLNPAKISWDASHRAVSDTEKSTWNGKQAALVSGTNIKTINGSSILGSGNLEVITDVSDKMDKSGGTFTGDVTFSGYVIVPSDSAIINGLGDKLLSGYEGSVFIGNSEGDVTLEGNHAYYKNYEIATLNDIPSLTGYATEAFVNSSINALAAYYITKNAAGDPFATKAELTSATKFYSGGVERTPTRNDYCIVSADESHDGNTTRYIFTTQWEFQYTFNYQFTQAQWNSIRSGITSTKVSSYDTHIADTVKHITAAERTAWNAKQAALVGSGTGQNIKTVNGTNILGSGNIGVGVTSVSVKMNGATKGTVTSTGEIDLGTVITSHQDISGKMDKSGGTFTGDVTFEPAAITLEDGAEIQNENGDSVLKNDGDKIYIGSTHYTSTYLEGLAVYYNDVEIATVETSNKVTFGTTAPTEKRTGDIWIDTSN